MKEGNVFEKVDNKKYVKELLIDFLEDAPTLWGLPIALLPHDFLVNKKSSNRITLDFTMSKDFNKIVKFILDKVFDEITEDELNKYEGLEKNTFLFSKFRFVYHTSFYDKIHLDAKRYCSDYLMNAFKKYTRKLPREHVEKLKEELGLIPKAYPRGILDYDYSILGVDIFSQNVISEINEAMKTKVSQYVEKNILNGTTPIRNVEKVSSNTVGNQDSPFYLLSVDSTNLHYIRERIEKILAKHNEFYDKHIFDYKNVKSFKVNTISKPIPYIKIESNLTNKVYMYITPYSAYLGVVIDNNVEAYTLYHIGRNSNKECKERMIHAIKKFDFPTYCLDFTKLIYLR